MYRSTPYRSFVAGWPCLVCGRTAVAHHEPLGMGGTALKAPDTHCLPLCVEHHAERHQVGQETFYRKHNIDPQREIIRLLTGWMERYV